MTRSKSIALAFYFGAALAGAAIGVSADRVMVRSATNPFDRFAARKLLWDDLHLTQSQRDSADRILDERNRADSILRAPVRPATDSVNAHAIQRLMQVLTPEQKTIYDQMQRDNAPRTEKK
jgi:Spy/CpxP family protein refolding chaperone